MGSERRNEQGEKERAGKISAKSDRSVEVIHLYRFIGWLGQFASSAFKKISR